jgi:YgiT-type zinc finger domain-containing protein
MLKTISVCPSCGSNTLKKVRRNWTGKVNGQTYVVPDLEYYICSQCGEKIYDRQAMRKIEAHSPAFVKEPVEKRSA